MAENVKEGKITAQLYDLAITERKDDYSARIVTRESRTLEDLAHLAVANRTDLNLNTLINAYNLLKAVAIQELINGSNVEFGLGIDGLVINGVFIGEGAQFDPKEHKLSISRSLIVPPALTPGDYNLELTTQYSASNALLKQLRTTVFQYVLNVPQQAAE